MEWKGGNMNTNKKRGERGDDNTSTAISMPKDLLRAAKIACINDDRNFSEYMRRLIKNDLIARGLLNKNAHKGS